MTMLLTPERIRTASLYPLKTLEDRTAGTARILITRYWPRGLTSDRVHDWWGKRLAPTVDALKAYKSGYITWETFADAYRGHVAPELPVLRMQVAQMVEWYGAITLLCHEHDAPEDAVRCHRRLLREMLLETGGDAS